MRRRIALVPALLLLVFGANGVWAFSTGPTASRTGAPALGAYPAELNCAQCHSGTVNDPNGKIEILDLPFRYEPGQMYPVRVRLSYALADTAGVSNPKWGFELTAVSLLDGTGAGTILAPNAGPGPAYPDSLLIKLPTSGSFLGSGRQYIEQSGLSTRTDQPGPVEWVFNWVAPTATPGDVYFYAAGNAANGNASSSGDHIFTGVSSTTAAIPGVPAANPSTVTALMLLLVSVGTGVVITRRRAA